MQRRTVQRKLKELTQMVRKDVHLWRARRSLPSVSPVGGCSYQRLGSSEKSSLRRLGHRWTSVTPATLLSFRIIILLIKVCIGGKKESTKSFQSIFLIISLTPQFLKDNRSSKIQISDITHDCTSGFFFFSSLILIGKNCLKTDVCFSKCCISLPSN